jgi:hypothetical protein
MRSLALLVRGRDALTRPRVVGEGMSEMRDCLQNASSETKRTTHGTKTMTSDDRRAYTPDGSRSTRTRGRRRSRSVEAEDRQGNRLTTRMLAREQDSAAPAPLWGGLETERGTSASRRGSEKTRLTPPEIAGDGTAIDAIAQRRRLRRLLGRSCQDEESRRWRRDLR